MDEDIMRALGLLARRAPGAGGLAGLLGNLPAIQSTQSAPQLGGGLLAPAHMPQMAQPEMTSQQAPGLFERFKRGLLPTPAGIEGLLSPEDLGKARHQGLLDMGLSLLGNSRGAPGQDAPGLAQALGGAVQAGRQSFGQNTMGTLQQRVQLGELAQKQDQLEKRKAMIARLQQQFPNFAQMNEQQQSMAIRSIFGEMLTNGEFDAAGKMASVIPAMSRDPKVIEPKWEDFGGYKALMTHDGRELQRVAKTPSPKDPNAPDHAQELSQQRMFQRAQQLGDDFRQQTKMHQTVADMLGVLKTTGPAALKGDPQAQQGLIFAYMKLLDPGSTVREGEFATAANGGSVPEKIRAQYNKVLSGEFLDPAQVQRFLSQAEQQKTGWVSRFKPMKARYEGQARRWGINPDDVVFDYYNALDASSAAPAPAQKGSASNVRQYLR